jgi:preprotein translocase subunit SecB
MDENRGASREGYFKLTLVGIGNFELLEGLSGEDKKTLLHINAPPIMFPYMRALISTFTANCGDAVPLLIVPTQFFSGQLEAMEVE